MYFYSAGEGTEGLLSARQVLCLGLHNSSWFLSSLLHHICFAGEILLLLCFWFICWSSSPKSPQTVVYIFGIAYTYNTLSFKDCFNCYHCILVKLVYFKIMHDPWLSFWCYLYELSPDPCQIHTSQLRTVSLCVLPLYFLNCLLMKRSLPF